MHRNFVFLLAKVNFISGFYLFYYMKSKNWFINDLINRIMDHLFICIALESKIVIKKFFRSICIKMLDTCTLYQNVGTTLRMLLIVTFVY